ncbi:MAG: glycosyltransferase family 9 protein [Bacteroidota bacterium]|nr:glycosyltransferase family 9 protein [Bacteroidota bacterium]
MAIPSALRTGGRGETRPPRVCIFRTDRIGDVILTLPAAEAVKRAIPDAHVALCVQEYTADLARLSPFVDEVLTVAGRDVVSELGGFIRLLRRKKFDLAVFAYPRPRLAWAAFRAGISMRSGTAYRWYSLLFTHRVREHRKSAGRHERDYTLALLDRLGIPTRPFPQPRLEIPGEHRQRAAEVVARHLPSSVSRFVVLHPGSGGSAKEWGPGRFGLLAARLDSDCPDVAVLVTGTPDERPIVEAVREASGGKAIPLDEHLPLPVFAALLEQSVLTVSNSTGPIHIAAALGVPVVGLYPFERSCNPRRWGPLGEKTAVLTPPKEPECPACLQEHCPRHDDMARIAVADVFTAVRSLL